MCTAELLVGVLSILVTVLIGWNVYTLIDLKNHVKQNQKTKQEVQKLKKTNNENLSQLEKTLALLFLNEDVCREESIRTYESLRHWICYIKINSEVGNYEVCNRAITKINDLYNKNLIEYIDKQNLKELIRQIPNKKNIKKIKTLIMIVEELNENTELMNELRNAAFEVLLLHPATTRDTWVQTLMEQYAMEVTDALGTDEETTRERLNKMWGEDYTDTAGVTRSYAEWAALFATDAAITEYYKTIPM